MEESNDNIKKTILVAEDVESNFLLLKALLGKTYNTLTMVQKRSKCSITISRILS